jgi:hypothetical protein
MNFRHISAITVILDNIINVRRIKTPVVYHDLVALFIEAIEGVVG